MSSENSNGAKISGYLEKKGKTRMVSTWKKYWFVLEGRLLLYYRSRAEYDAISPCKGSISLGPPCNLKPAIASSCVFQLESRANTVTLRAENQYEQDKWMQALLSALNQNLSHTTKMCHFRYSADDLLPSLSDKIKRKPNSSFSRQNTLPERLVMTNDVDDKKNHLKRIKSLRTYSFGGSLQSIIESTTKESTKLSINRSFQSTSSLQKVWNISNKEISSKEPSKILDSETLVQSQERVVLSEQNDSLDVGEFNENERVTDDANTSQIKNKADIIYDEIDNNYSYLSIFVESSEYCSIDNVECNKSKTHLNKGEDDAINTTDDSIKDKICDAPTTIKKTYELDVGKKCKKTILFSPSINENELTDEKSVDDNIVPSKSKHINTFSRIDQMDSKKKHKEKSSFLIRILKKMKNSNGKSGCAKQNKKFVDEKVQKNNNNMIKLSEFEVILEKKNHHHHVNKEKIKSTQWNKLPNKMNRSPSKKPSQNIPADNIDVPSLPPKKLIFTKDELQRNMSLNIPRPKLRDKMKIQINPIEDNDDDELKTIDEILDELDIEKNKRGFSKVKELVERFNDTYNNVEQVEIRKKCKDVTCRYSDDLNLLLDKLCEVTSAPILKLGESNSLVVTPTSEHEWKNLNITMVRTLSEPDYDIPRPHSALQILPTLGQGENPMKPTRFLGPVLIDCDKNDEDAFNRNLNFALDSLETESNNKGVGNSSIEGERSLFSYNSHSYYNLKPRPMKTLDRKLIKSVCEDCLGRPTLTEAALINQCEHINYKEDTFQMVQSNINSSSFEDSLEPLETN